MLPDSPHEFFHVPVHIQPPDASVKGGWYYWFGAPYSEDEEGRYPKDWPAEWKPGHCEDGTPIKPFEAEGVDRPVGPFSTIEEARTACLKACEGNIDPEGEGRAVVSIQEYWGSDWPNVDPSDEQGNPVAHPVNRPFDPALALA